MRVVVCGPPHSGKSTFSAALITGIRERQRDRGFHLSFGWTPLDVTDNSIAALQNPDKEIPRKRDVEWSDERAEERKAVFEAQDQELVLADAPGKITDQLEILVEPADAVILLASKQKEDQAEAWRSFAMEHDLEVFASLTTVLDEDIEPGWDEGGGRDKREGVLRSAEREAFEESNLNTYDDTSRRMIRQLATDLMKEATA